MSRTQKILLAALAALAVVVIALALRNPKPPFLPSDRAHAEWTGAAPCLECHGPGGPSPQSTNHPLGQDCLRCHGRR